MSVEKISIETPDYSPWFSGRFGEFKIPANKDTIGKGI